MLERKPRKDRTEVTFVLPAGAPPGPLPSTVLDLAPGKVRF
ncbi:hypothetical protein [Streptomyces virginiae]